MINRKKNHIENKRGKMKKLVGTVFLIGIISGSYTVAFAQQDIEMLLSQWFEKQKSEAISKIELAINNERDDQTNLLKEQLQLEIQNAEVALEQFTNEEISKRIEGIRAYAQQLKDSIEIDSSDEHQKVVDQIDRIYENAIQQLSNVQNKEEVKPPVESKEPVPEEVVSPPSPIEGEKQPGGPDHTIPIDPPAPVNPSQPEAVTPIRDDSSQESVPTGQEPNPPTPIVSETSNEGSDES